MVPPPAPLHVQRRKCPSMESHAAAACASTAAAAAGRACCLSGNCTVCVHIPPQTPCTTATSVMSCCTPCCTDGNHCSHCTTAGDGIEWRAAEYSVGSVVQQPLTIESVAGRQASSGWVVASALQGGMGGVQGGWTTARRCVTERLCVREIV